MLSAPILETPIPAAHGKPTIAVHWLTAGLIVASVAAVLSREVIDHEPTRALLLAFHRQAGITVLALLVLRIALRIGYTRRIASRSAASRWLARLASAAHTTMYTALLGVPLLGWALSDARGQHPSWFGALVLPVLSRVDPDRADQLEDWHAWSAWAFGALIALHIGAALWHHFIRRDDVLTAMLPGAAGVGNRIHRAPGATANQGNP